MGLFIKTPKQGILPFAEVLATAQKHNLTDLVVPYLHNEDRKDLTAYKKTAEKLNQGAEEASKIGIRLAIIKNSNSNP